MRGTEIPPFVFSLLFLWSSTLIYYFLYEYWGWLVQSRFLFLVFPNDFYDCVRFFQLSSPFSFWATSVPPSLSGVFYVLIFLLRLFQRDTSRNTCVFLWNVKCSLLVNFSSVYIVKIPRKLIAIPIAQFIIIQTNVDPSTISCSSKVGFNVK